MLSTCYQIASKIIRFCYFFGSRAGKNGLRIKFLYSHSMKSFGLHGYVVFADITVFEMLCYYISYFLLLKLCWSKVGHYFKGNTDQISPCNATVIWPFLYLNKCLICFTTKHKFVKGGVWLDLLPIVTLHFGQTHAAKKNLFFLLIML